MNKPLTDANAWEARVKNKTVRLAYWTGAWVFSMAVATFGPEFLWPGNSVVTALAIAINLGLGAGMVVANKRHLDSLDELQKKVALDAMALALGVGLVGGLGYSLLDTTHLINFHAQISHLVMLIGLTYLVATIIGKSHYQ